MKIVVSQPKSLPWLGLFEQIRLANISVHFEDGQVPVGQGFIFGAQIRTLKGSQWLSASIDHGQSRLRASWFSGITCKSWVALQTRWGTQIAG